MLCNASSTLWINLKLSIPLLELQFTNCCFVYNICNVNSDEQDMNSLVNNDKFKKKSILSSLV